MSAYQPDSSSRDISSVTCSPIVFLGSCCTGVTSKHLRFVALLCCPLPRWQSAWHARLGIMWYPAYPPPKPCRVGWLEKSRCCTTQHILPWAPQTNMCVRDHPVKGGFNESNIKILNAIALCSTSRNSFLLNFSTKALNSDATPKKDGMQLRHGSYRQPCVVIPSYFHGRAQGFWVCLTLNQSSDGPDSYRLAPGNLKQ